MLQPNETFTKMSTNDRHNKTKSSKMTRSKTDECDLKPLLNVIQINKIEICSDYLLLIIHCYISDRIQSFASRCCPEREAGSGI